MKTGFVFFLIPYLCTIQLNAQSKAVSEEQQAETVQVVADSTISGYRLTQQDIFSIGDVDLGKWVQTLPHFWVSRLPQFGQPVYAQQVGLPVWMTKIFVSDLDLSDPIWGFPDISIIPTIRLAAMATGDPSMDPPPALRMELENRKITRPFSQVFYHSGDNQLNEVDILFQRGFAGNVDFQAAGNFFQYKGIYNNSDIDHFSAMTRLKTPLSQRIQLNYFLFTNKMEDGYPGEIAPDYSVRYPDLRRSVRRQVHRITITDTIAEQRLLIADLQYTLQSNRYHSQNPVFEAGSLIARNRLSLIQNTKRTSLELGIHLDANRFKMQSMPAKIELPIGVFFRYRKRIADRVRWFGSGSWSLIGTNWPHFEFLSGFDWRPHRTTYTSGRLFFQQTPPPFTWREAVVLPFENQPYLFVPESLDSLFVSENRARHSARNLGGELLLTFEPGSKVAVDQSFLLHRVSRITFPTAGEILARSLLVGKPYWNWSWFVRIRCQPFTWASVEGSSQFSWLSRKELPELLEVPDWRFRLQFSVWRSLFENEVLAKGFLYIEQIGPRKSAAYDFALPKFLILDFPAQTLVNTKLSFTIGDVEIFFYWYNLLNRAFSYRAYRPIPGWQFQFGVRWQFWD